MNLWRGTAEERLQLVDVDPVGETVKLAAVEPEPFDAFYHREYRSLRVLAHALVGPGSADDVVQESMLAAYRRWDEVQLLHSPSGWVRRVCVRKAVSALRRRSVEQRALGRLRALPPTDAGPHAEDEEFWSSVRRLPARQAQAVCLHYALDLGVAEVAAILGCTEGTVKVHLSRARAALARAFGEDGGVS